jgi:hypothetical protein
MQAEKGQCKGATRTRKLQGARDREDTIGGASRRELCKLGVDAGAGCRSLAAQRASVAMPRPVSGRLLLHPRCRGSYFGILVWAALQRLGLRLVLGGIECPHIKTVRRQLFVGYVLLRVSKVTRRFCVSIPCQYHIGGQASKYACAIVSVCLRINFHSRFKLRLCPHLLLFKRTACVAWRFVRTSDGYLVVYAL